MRRQRGDEANESIPFRCVSWLNVEPWMFGDVWER
jgi:hypothetical protein